MRVDYRGCSFPSSSEAALKPVTNASRFSFPFERMMVPGVTDVARANDYNTYLGAVSSPSDNSVSIQTVLASSMAEEPESLLYATWQERNS
jgi:hypothetical protein